MFEIRLKLDFPASHKLEGYDGDCARLHGHNWGVEAFLSSKEPDNLGMVMDFRLLKTYLKDVVAPWDHEHLNNLEDFRGVNPTAENIAKKVFDKLSEKLFASGKKDICVSKITVWENERSNASFMIGDVL